MKMGRLGVDDKEGNVCCQNKNSAYVPIFHHGYYNDLLHGMIFPVDSRDIIF